MAPRDIAQLLFQIDTAYDRPSWHGPNLKAALRGVTPAQAAWRPGRGRHNIWELLVHAAYWKYAAWRRLTGARRGAFPHPGSNWFARPVTPTAAAWRSDVALLADVHASLREAVARLSPGALDRRLARTAGTPRILVTGVAAHDLYHAGQIQLLKRLAPR